jgi:magnesium chelatase family protein
LEGLRQPLEDRFVTIVRVASAVTFPSDFLLVAAANPCPCGYLGSAHHPCTCTPTQIQKYRARISGPLMDRIDLHVEVPALKTEELTEDVALSVESSEVIRERVKAARGRQLERFQNRGLVENAQMSVRQLKEFCVLTGEGKSLLRRAIHSFGLSARAYDRILRVARTIADLDASPSLESKHLAEAISHRFLDRLTEGERISN